MMDSQDLEHGFRDGRSMTQQSTPIHPSVQGSGQTLSTSATNSSPLPFKGARESLLKASEQPGTRIQKVLLERLLSLIEHFNANATYAMTAEKALHDQFTCLYDIEQVAYMWQREHNAKANAPDRAAMNTLLMEIEENHRHLVTQNRAAHFSLWVKPGTEKDAEAAMKKFWESIASGHENIRIFPSISPIFENSIYASMAKLLQTAHGRDILFVLNALQPSPDRTIQIAETWQGQFASFPAHPQWKAGSWAFPYARTQVLEDKCHRASNAGPGRGTGSYVQIDLTPSPPLEGEGGEPLFMPAFITLGHELGHALHNLGGHAADPLDMDICQGYPTDPVERELWSEPEEYQNITKNENMLRDEHGLPRRKYHKDAATVQMAVRAREKLVLQARLTQAEMKIPEGLHPAVRQRLPQLATLDSILLTGLTEEDMPLWTVPGQLEEAEGLMQQVERAINGVIAEVQKPHNDTCNVM